MKEMLHICDEKTVIILDEFDKLLEEYWRICGKVCLNNSLEKNVMCKI